MTVKELIEKLQKFDEELDVRIWVDDASTGGKKEASVHRVTLEADKTEPNEVRILLH